MKKIVSLLVIISSFSVILVFSMLQAGCEEAKGLAGLTIDPASVTLSTNGQTVVFTVTGGITNDALALPLEWRVSDSGLGTILFNSGTSATYRRTSANGVNTIIAKDQYDNEGYATVNQNATSYSLTLDSSDADDTIEVGQAVTITITSTGSQAPYSWSLESGPGTVTGSSGSTSAAYTSTTTGTGVIKVTDANGASGVIAIVVQDTSGGGGGSGGGPGGG